MLPMLRYSMRLSVSTCLIRSGIWVRLHHRSGSRSKFAQIMHNVNMCAYTYTYIYMCVCVRACVYIYVCMCVPVPGPGWASASAIAEPLRTVGVEMFWVLHKAHGSVARCCACYSGDVDDETVQIRISL